MQIAESHASYFEGRPTRPPRSTVLDVSARRCVLGVSVWLRSIVLTLVFVGATAIAHAQSGDVVGQARAAQPIDLEIGQSVVAALESKDNVAVRDLLVEVEDGIVTLEGTVETSAEKHLAARYTGDVVGVQGVVNAIVVNPALGISESGQ